MLILIEILVNRLITFLIMKESLGLEFPMSRTLAVSDHYGLQFLLLFESENYFSSREGLYGIIAMNKEGQNKTDIQKLN